MAIQKRSRENLLAEATAYRRRVLVRLPSPPGVPMLARQPFLEVLLGQRPGGSWSVYFGEEPALQFDADNRLRRLLEGGRQYAAEAGHLCQLQRDSLGGQVRLQRRQLEPAEHSQLLERCRNWIGSICEPIEGEACQVLGRVPERDDGWLVEGCQRLRCVSRELEIAATPTA